MFFALYFAMETLNLILMVLGYSPFVFIFAYLGVFLSSVRAHAFLRTLKPLGEARGALVPVLLMFCGVAALLSAAVIPLLVAHTALADFIALMASSLLCSALLHRTALVCSTLRASTPAPWSTFMLIAAGSLAVLVTSVIHIYFARFDGLLFFDSGNFITASHRCALLFFCASLCFAFFLRKATIQLVIRVVVCVAYRVRVSGETTVPLRGGAVIVANHESFFDAFVLGALLPRRVRFVMDYRMANLPVLKYFFRLCDVIPIASRARNPELLERAMNEIAKSVEGGEVVVIFPEGRCTRDGEIGEFRPGIEWILKRTPAPVVPASIDGLWGSFSSYERGNPLTSWPRRFRAKIKVHLGESVPVSKVRAQLKRGTLRHELRQRVMKLKTQHM